MFSKPLSVASRPYDDRQEALPTRNNKILPDDAGSPGIWPDGSDSRHGTELPRRSFLAMRTALVIAVLLVLFALTAGWALYAWMSLDNVQMSGHGYAAMALGIIFSLALGFGLMGLMFYSNRHGYDDGPDRRY